MISITILIVCLISEEFKMNKNRRVLSSILICMLAHTSTFGHEKLSSNEQSHQSLNQKFIDKNDIQDKKDENKRIKRGLIRLSILSVLGVPTYYLGRKIYKYSQWENDKRLAPYINKERLHETLEEALDYLSDEMEETAKKNLTKCDERGILPATILKIFDFGSIFNFMDDSEKSLEIMIAPSNNGLIVRCCEELNCDESKFLKKIDKFDNCLVTYEFDNYHIKSKTCKLVYHTLSKIFKNFKKIELVKLINGFATVLNKSKKSIKFWNGKKEAIIINYFID